MTSHRWVRDEYGDLIGVGCDGCAQTVLELSLCPRCASGDLLCSRCRAEHMGTAHAETPLEAA